MENNDRPSRFLNPSCRLSDDFADIFEAEYRHDDRPTDHEAKTAYEAYEEIHHGYDESQAIEVMAAEASWLYGEKFYMPVSPAFEDDDMFVQDFGLPKSEPVPREVFWISIIEDEPIPSEEADKRCGLGRFWDVLKQDQVKWDVGASLKEPLSEAPVVAAIALSFVALLKQR